MFQVSSITGKSLPPRTVCLTFDDGPNNAKSLAEDQTLKAAQYLSDNNIRATFFAVGRQLYEDTRSLEIVARLGHSVGNHSFDHVDLPAFRRLGGDVIHQLLTTDALLSTMSPDCPIFFRPPYGRWSRQLSELLNSNLFCRLRHVGPIGWDIDSTDWLYWKHQLCPEVCAKTCLATLQATERNNGIILLHDSSADDRIARNHNKSSSLLEHLIPMLKENGYSFAALDEVPDIQHAMRDGRNVHLATMDDRYVHLDAKDGSFYLAPDIIGRSVFTCHLVNRARVALKANNDHFVCAREVGRIGPLTADRTSRDVFDLVNVRDEIFALRSRFGHFVGAHPQDHRLVLMNRTALTYWNLIKLVPLSPPYKPPVDQAP